jgi:hypothetical protein
VRFRVVIYAPKSGPKPGESSVRPGDRSRWISGAAVAIQGRSVSRQRQASEQVSQHQNGDETEMAGRSSRTDAGQGHLSEFIDGRIHENLNCVAVSH